MTQVGHDHPFKWVSPVKLPLSERGTDMGTPPPLPVPDLGIPDQVNGKNKGQVMGWGY